ncbi:MAG: LexA family protein [Desulfovibrio sp.]|uniref:LexA family protein n=1 Tax=Desulfovibrio sp. 7SRBS1 TaxID=3378064 RepID=UPI003B3E7308
MKVNSIFTPSSSPESPLPLFLCPVPAGFPSPADDYIEKNLDLNTYLVRNRAATFFIRVSGESMLDAGIQDGDILVVDRSAGAATGCIVVAVLDGELTVKYLRKKNGRVTLVPANDRYPEMEIFPEQDFYVWGTVVGVVRSYR